MKEVKKKRLFVNAHILHIRFKILKFSSNISDINMLIVYLSSLSIPFKFVLQFSLLATA